MSFHAEFDAVQLNKPIEFNEHAPQRSRKRIESPMPDPSIGRQREWTAFDIEGIKTLPLFTLFVNTLEEIRPFSEGRVKLNPADPDYASYSYDFTLESLGRVESDPVEAKQAILKWPEHRSRYQYFIQFRDDPTRKRIQALHDHTALVSALCDARLGIDTSDLWIEFDNIPVLESIYSKYRADDNRETKYKEYANELVYHHESIDQVRLSVFRLIQRIARQIDLKAPIWKSMPPIHHPATVKENWKRLRLFYSYSHRDKGLRDSLESHLSVLKRNGLIENWHDRKIGAGIEWKDSIDANLEAADIILLLVSSDFLNSDYCYDVEMIRAMERHAQASAKVIPIILRPCDWADAPFGKLQALPADAKAVTLWSNKDQAFADIAKGLKSQIKQFAGEG